MDDLLTLVLLALPACLLACGLVSSRWANRHRDLACLCVTALAGLQSIVAVTLAIAFATGSIGVISGNVITGTAEPLFSVSIYYDGISALMLALVSFVGLVISNYSIRYLDGEPNQGAYFRWTGFTIGAVSLMVVSGNLLMFIAAWVLTSLGLHHLLLHYGHRPAAQRAAWTKFTISRIGDAALLAALVLVYSEFQTTEFAELFAAIRSPAFAVTPAISAASFLLVVGAITKSAQFPFHTWLPQTMETPTPVSALMHAGIVNAGGYLIIRTSPLVSTTPSALAVLAMIGALDGLFCSVGDGHANQCQKIFGVFNDRTNGVHDAAMRVGCLFSGDAAHPRALALQSSCVSWQRQCADAPRRHVGALPADQSISITKLAMVGTIMVAFYCVALMLFGVDPSAKPGGVLLGGILCLALTSWIGQVLKTGNHQLAVGSLLTASLLCLAYVLSFVVVDGIVAASLPMGTAPALAWLVAAIVSCGFGAVFVLQATLPAANRPPWMHAFYVHVANGFYLENLLRRVFGKLASS